MAVTVDVCEADVTCFDNVCRRLAQLSMDDGGGPRGYCLDCIECRLGVRRQRGAEIVYTDTALDILMRAGRPGDHDLRRTAIYQLAAKLQGVGYTVAINPDDPELDVSGDGGKIMSVTCRRRASDGGKLWYFEPPGTPLTEADHVFDAIVMVKGRANGNA